MRRHPAVGSGAMTHEELAELIAQGEEVKGDEKPRRRHDEAQYTVHPKQNPIR
jgi:curved DNA-binding protein CbpA